MFWTIQKFHKKYRWRTLVCFRKNTTEKDNILISYLVYNTWVISLQLSRRDLKLVAFLVFIKVHLNSQFLLKRFGTLHKRKVQFPQSLGRLARQKIMWNYDILRSGSRVGFKSLSNILNGAFSAKIVKEF